jgi:hypothetical protein
MFSSKVALGFHEQYCTAQDEAILCKRIIRIGGCIPSWQPFFSLGGLHAVDVCAMIVAIAA